MTPNPYLERIVNGDRLRVLFINDIGFQYGAGIALLRQIQSFLLLGHEVASLSWGQGPEEGRLPIVPTGATGRWWGASEVPHLHLNQGMSPEQLVDSLVYEAKLRYPDVIILGNLHGAQWPLQLIEGLKAIGCPVIPYVHDCYLFTGRCAYTGGCTLYRSGCNETCPTADQYPWLEPERIFDAWLLRRQLFCGADGVPLATNSQWILQQLRDALPGLRFADCVYLGLDEHLFKPIDRSLARRLLGIPEDQFVILGGAVNVNDYRKGGHIFQEVMTRMQEQALFMVFGAKSNQLEGVYGTGLLRDFRKMPLVYSAADVFVGTSLEEAFGQTFLEASACGIPVVGFRVDGVPEVARHGLNARLADERTVDAMIEEIEFFRQNPDQRQVYGAAGRALVEAEFTLKAQGDRWMAYLQKLAKTYDLAGVY